MASIYAKARFTLILACCDGIDDDIPGVNMDRQINTATCRVGETHIQPPSSSYSYDVRRSTWATRGWTYQENVLSSRRLYVMANEAIWVCLHGTAKESRSDYWSDPDHLLLRRQGLEMAVATPTKIGVRSARSIGAYMHHSSEYNCRTLTFVSDIYHAFAGVGRAIYPQIGSSPSLLSNIPIRDLDQALLWYLEEEKGNGKRRYSLRSTEMVALPSWSWSSIAGRLDYFGCYGSLVQ
jgi:hypothetical protein